MVRRDTSPKRNVADPGSIPGASKGEVAELVDANQVNENLSGVAIRCGQDRPDEYGKTGGQDVKRGVITPRLSSPCRFESCPLQNMQGYGFEAIQSVRVRPLLIAEDRTTRRVL